MPNSPLAHAPALAHDLAAAADRLQASTVAVVVGGDRGRRAAPRQPPTRSPSGYGSGVIWRADGVIITNAHVARTDALTVVLPDGRRVAARVVGRDPRRDLAILQADAGGLVPALPGDPAALRPGQVVLALGHPLGLANALAVGIVHGRVGALIRADVRLLPGNSGGPLADAAGRVLGINTMVVNGLGVAVSIREVEALLREGATGDGGTARPDVHYAA